MFFILVLFKRICCSNPSNLLSSLAKLFKPIDVLEAALNIHEYIGQWHWRAKNQHYSISNIYLKNVDISDGFQ